MLQYQLKFFFVILLDIKQNSDLSIHSAVILVSAL